jgi:hypothetical protein
MTQLYLFVDFAAPKRPRKARARRHIAYRTKEGLPVGVFKDPGGRKHLDLSLNDWGFRMVPLLPETLIQVVDCPQCRRWLLKRIEARERRQTPVSNTGVTSLGGAE